MRQGALLSAMAAMLICGGAWAADGVPAHLDAARAANARGDIARAAQEVEAALAELQVRLGRTLGEFMPPPPAGWQAETPETQGLAGAGGGLAVSRSYGKDDATLNAAVIIDSPAVAAAASQFAAPPSSQANVRKVKIGAEDALMRWDAANRSGDIVLVVGARALLQIEGDNLSSSDLLIEAAKAWNVAAIRKVLGG